MRVTTALMSKVGEVPDNSNKPFPVKNKKKQKKKPTTYVLKYKIYLRDTTLKD